MSTELWIETMRENFPMFAADESWQLEFVPEDPEGYEGPVLKALLRAITWDVYDGQRMVRDIKEQQVAIGRREHFELSDRYAAFLRASRRVLGACDSDDLANSVPEDCIHADVLDLVSARDEEAFVAALSTSKRLGGWLK